MEENFRDKIGLKYTQDVLSCLANLSNDEVFTPPKTANAMLDMLPREIFSDPNAKFLDPATKTGVFLREIAKRLLVGLKDKIPNLQERIDHIFHEQLFGIAITELTSLISRRSVYCSKYPDGEYSVSKFSNAEGNIFYKRMEHTFKNGKCVYCGASKDKWDRGDDKESYAYDFIHDYTHILDLEELLKMKFDVIISNPPYQLNYGNNGGNASKAGAIYNLFIDSAIKLNPRYVVMITPSRWMTKTADGISDAWVDKMINCNKFEVIHDFESGEECFPSAPPEGGVNYFLYNSDYNGECKYFYHSSGVAEPTEQTRRLNEFDAGIIIRDVKALSVVGKICRVEGNYYSTDNNFSSLVGTKDYFTNKEVLMSNWADFSKTRTEYYNVKYYLNKNTFKIPYGWINIGVIPKHKETSAIYKVYIPAAHGSRETVLGKPFVGEPMSVCSQTYLVIGYDPEKHHFTPEQCCNIVSYIKTKFFRYLVSIKKKTQNGSRDVYQFVPLQNFTGQSDIDWDVPISEIDRQLYDKYDFDDNEREFIEKAIKPMADGD